MANPTEEADLLATLYALGQLEEAEEADFEARLQRDAGLRARLQTYQRVTEALARAAPRQSPPPQLRQRLLQSLDEQRQVCRPLSAGSRLIASGDLPWQDTPVQGVRIKPLDADEQQRSLSLLVRMEPGAKLPGHRHARGERLFMLAGEARIGSHPVSAGDYACSEPGSDHPPTTSDQGCTFLAIASLDDIYDLAGSRHSLATLAALP